MAPGVEDEFVDIEARRERSRPPLEFLMSLSRIEETIQNISDPASTKGLPSLLLKKVSAENPEDSWRENLKMYEQLLEKKLAAWTTLAPGATEFYRSRIEGLMPMLERAIDERMRAKAVAEAGAAAATAAAAGAAATSNAEGAPISGTDVQEQPDQAAAMVPAMGSPPVVGGLEPLGEPRGVDSSSLPARGQATGSGAPDSQPAVPWRRRGAANPSNTAATAASRQAIEADLLNIGTGMLGTVTSISKTVKRDNDVLGKISDDMHGRLDKVTAQTATGKQMMRSGQLGFMCTMVMLVTSVIIFFMMIPFIIFT